MLQYIAKDDKIEILISERESILFNIHLKCGMQSLLRVLDCISRDVDAKYCASLVQNQLFSKLPAAATDIKDFYTLRHQIQQEWITVITICLIFAVVQSHLNYADLLLQYSSPCNFSPHMRLDVRLQPHMGFNAAECSLFIQPYSYPEFIALAGIIRLSRGFPCRYIMTKIELYKAIANEFITCQ